MLEELSTNVYGIGWAAQLHVKDYPNNKSLPIAVNETSTAYSMTPQTLVIGYIHFVNGPPGEKVDPKVREVLRFYLSRDGQAIISEADMYYPLTL